MNKKRYYLAYGSNLNMAQMRYRCPGAVPLGTAELKNYRLVFKGSRSGSYLTIVEADEVEDGCTVPVGVWAVTESDEERLDRYEGYPAFYYKTEMDITYKGLLSKKERKVRAFVYIMHEDRFFGVPSSRYMETCRQGYTDFGFDGSILTDAYRLSKEETTRLWKNNY